MSKAEKQMQLEQQFQLEQFLNEQLHDYFGNGGGGTTGTKERRKKGRKERPRKNRETVGSSLGIDDVDDYGSSYRDNYMVGNCEGTDATKIAGAIPAPPRESKSYNRNAHPRSR